MTEESEEPGGHGSDEDTCQVEDPQSRQRSRRDCESDGRDGRGLSGCPSDERLGGDEPTLFAGLPLGREFGYAGLADRLVVPPEGSVSSWRSGLTRQAHPGKETGRSGSQAFRWRRCLYPLRIKLFFSLSDG